MVYLVFVGNSVTAFSKGNNCSGFPDGSMVKNLSANAGDVRDAGLSPGLGRLPRVGNGNPLQFSCLGNPMNQTRLSTAADFPGSNELGAQFW